MFYSWKRTAAITAALAVAVTGLGTVTATASVPADNSAPAAERARPQQISEEHATDVTITDRQVIKRDGAAFIKTHFDSLALAAGDYVTVANPAGTESYTY